MFFISLSYLFIKIKGVIWMEEERKRCLKQMFDILTDYTDDYSVMLGIIETLKLSVMLMMSEDSIKRIVENGEEKEEIKGIG